MRQLTYLEPGRVEWTEAPDPEAGPTDVIIEPIAVARCDLDAAMVGAGLFTGPYPVGHEFVGIVTEVGSDVSRWREGDRIAAPFQISCGACPSCRDRRFAACVPHRARAGAAFGFGPDGGDHGGAVADLVLVPHADHMLIRAPDGVAPEALASVSDNVADAYRAVGPPLRERPGAEVLILGGAGDSIGYYAVQWARALGAERVRYVDTDAARCEIAARLGADALHLTDGWPRRVDRAPITMLFSTEPGAVSTAILSTDDYGICTSAAIQFEPATAVPMLDMYTKGITFHTSRVDSRRFLPEVLELVASGAVDPLEVPTRIVAWNDAAEAWPEPGIKLVVTRGTGR